MYQGLGRHRRAAQLLTEAMDPSPSQDAIVECLHLRGEPRSPTLASNPHSHADSLLRALLL